MPKDHNEFSLETIFQICHEVKKNNKTIGFTHGVFDLFHFGHLHFLQESAKLCDYLIVALDQDSNLPIYKDPKRPIICEEERLHILKEVKCVNYAFINRLPMNDESYLYLYNKLKADIITIGYNHGFADRVKMYTKKLKIKLIQIKSKDIRISTSKIIARILEKYQMSEEELLEKYNLKK